MSQHIIKNTKNTYQVVQVVSFQQQYVLQMYAKNKNVAAKVRCLRLQYNCLLYADV